MEFKIGDRVQTMTYFGFVLPGTIESIYTGILGGTMADLLMDGQWILSTHVNNLERIPCHVNQEDDHA